jgi:DNA-directed RNA polymerase specialized sigma24 family protein
VFLRLLRARPFTRLANADALRAYVWRVADNVSRGYRRFLEAGSREKPLEDLGDAQVPSREPQPDEALEARNLLSVKLKGLTSVDHEILAMTVEGYDLGDIAEATGLSYSNAGVRLHRLRRRLRNALPHK